MTCDLRKHLEWEPLARDGRVSALLIRHARTAWNQERRFNGHADTPLDEVGQAQAQALARALAELPLAGVVSSPLRRALQTAAALTHGRPELAVQAEPGLIELDHGALDGMLAVDALRQHGELLSAWRQRPDQVRLPDGETLGECQERALLALRAHLDRQRPGPPLAVICHQLVLSAMLCAASGLPLSRYSDFSQPNTVVNLISWRDGELRVEAVGLTAHLADAPAG